MKNELNIKTDEFGYKTFEARCDVFIGAEETCGEIAEPEITWDTSSSSGDGFKKRYYPRYHTYWSCKKHGAVPVTINGVPCSLKPEDVIGEFEQIEEAKCAVVDDQTGTGGQDEL